MTLSPTAIEALFILALIFFNGLLAMSEIAVVSARRARLRQWQAKGNKGAQAAIELAEEPGRFLATIQIGITLVGILSGALGGVTIARALSVYLARLPALAPYAEPVSVGVVVLAITYMSLVLGELTPKAIGLNTSEKIAARVARPMQSLSRVAAPIVSVLDASTRGVLWLLRVRTSGEPPVTDEELKYMVDEGAEAGVFAHQEQAMIKGVLGLGERQIASLMTPRPDVVFLQLSDSAEDIRRKIIESGLSGFPLCDESIDEVRGVVRTKDILSTLLTTGEADLANLARPALFVPESMPALGVLDSFRDAGVRLAVVVDEYGSTEGIVTLNEVLQAVARELLRAEDVGAPSVTRRKDGSWLVDGTASVTIIPEALGGDELAAVDCVRCRTIGGFMMARLGRIPRVGDTVDWGGLRFEIMDMDGYRVDKVLAISIDE